MLAIIVAISFVALIVLSVAVVRIFFTLDKNSHAVEELVSTQQAQARRIEQMGSAITMIQNGLINISTGAQKLLATGAATPVTVATIPVSGASSGSLGSSAVPLDDSSVGSAGLKQLTDLLFKAPTTT